MPATSIPVIDIRALDDPSTLAALDAACREWGFFQVTEHGLDPALAGELRAAMQDFFSQPAESKRQILRTRDNPWGYYDSELTKNVRDWKEVFDYGPADGNRLAPRWPASMPAFRRTIEAYSTACEVLAFRLLGALAVNLGARPADLAGGFSPVHSSFLRLNHYPLCPAPARPTGLDRPDGGHLGVGYHTDAGALTLLLQDDKPGLEVWHDGGWHLVEPRDDALVINIGDVVQVWSNDAYRAALHRAVASDRYARYSAPYFFNPAYSADYAPLASMVSDSNPPKYRPINWGEFRSRRADGDYADFGEEIQISDYRTT